MNPFEKISVPAMSQNMEFSKMASTQNSNKASPHIHRQRQLSLEYHIGRFKITKVNNFHPSYSPQEPASLDSNSSNKSSRIFEITKVPKQEVSKPIKNYISYDQLLKDLF